MSIFKKKLVTPTDVQYRQFDTAQDINGVMFEKPVVFYAVGIKPETATSIACSTHLLEGNPRSMFDTFPSGVRFLLTESEAKQFSIGVLSYIECFACSIEEALLLINQRNKKRINNDRISLSQATGIPFERISELQVADKVLKHYLANYHGLCIEGDQPTSDLPY